MANRIRQTGIFVLVLAAASMFWGPSVRAEEAPLTNADVIALQKAGLPEQVIVSKIKQAPSENLDVSTSALLGLKQSGLSKDIIAAMLTRVAQRTPPTPTLVPTTVPPTPAASKAPAQKADSESGVDREKKKAASDTIGGKPCVANFKSEGGYWKGEIFRAFQEYQGVDKGKAFENILQSILSLQNMVITSSSKETGTISGQGSFNPVLGGAPKPAPLGVAFKDLPTGGFRVNIQFNVPSGTVAQKKMVQEVFCTILESVFQ